jgi:PAS domain S-box-containing protein
LSFDEKTNKEILNDLLQLRHALEASESRCRNAEEGIAKISDCFSKLVADPSRNINLLTALCGELLGATCTLYNRLEGDKLVSWGQWNTPPNYNPVDSPEGHICYDVIKKSSDQIMLIRRLPETPYAQSDPNVTQYGLQTYIGKAVKFSGSYVGSLCAVYQQDVVPSESEKMFIELIASAIGVEEKRKRAEDELKESERRFRSMLENIKLVSVILNAQGNITFCNDFLLKATGQQRDEILGRDWFETFIPSETRTEIRQIFLKTIQTGEFPAHYENEILSRGGKRLSIAWSNTPLYDHRGNITGTASIGEDITERKRTEEQIACLASIVQTIPEAVCSIDLQGNILSWNDGAEKMLGYSAEEIMGRHITLVLLKNMAEEELNRCISMLNTQGSFTGYESVRRAKDGRAVPVEVTAVAIKDKEQNITNYASIMRDLTERRKIEENRLKAEKIESLGVLAGGIAHDFNNLLTSIMGNISLAKVFANPGDKVYERLTEAEKASVRAKDLTNQLLTFSKGGMPIKKTVTIGDVIKEATNFALRGSNVGYELSIPDDLWAVKVDEGQIGQVMHNLILNAQQAMPKGGTIYIRCTNITIGENYFLPVKNGNYVRVSIHDYGTGIPKEHLHHIFEPYFTTKQKGSGLGLATSYSIVNRHEGHITVDSEVGKGTIFVMYLPASEEERSTPAKEEVARLLEGKGKILVMDDEEMVQDVVSEMLRSIGYEAVCARNGEEAIEAFLKAKQSDKPFDGVIMDLTIPGGMGGKEAIEKLLKIDPGVRAIVSSGYSNDPVMAHYAEHGFKGIVVKPFKIGELNRVLQKLLTK